MHLDLSLFPNHAFFIVIPSSGHPIRSDLEEPYLGSLYRMYYNLFVATKDIDEFGTRTFRVTQK